MPAAKEEDFLPLRDSVYNKLRQAILTGELPAGERLMEVHLGDKLGVSRTPIREAIRMLELEGLVTMIPRKGAMVSQITEKNMSDVLEVRRALDILCVQLACERITPEVIDELNKAKDVFEKAVLSSPMLEISSGSIPTWAAKAFSNVMIRLGKGKNYLPGSAPFSGKPDSAVFRPSHSSGKTRPSARNGVFLRLSGLFCLTLNQTGAILLSK